MTDDMERIVLQIEFRLDWDAGTPPAAREELINELSAFITNEIDGEELAAGLEAESLYVVMIEDIREVKIDE
jgi:hypothetical protein